MRISDCVQDTSSWKLNKKMVFICISQNLIVSLQRRSVQNVNIFIIYILNYGTGFIHFDDYSSCSQYSI